MRYILLHYEILILLTALVCFEVACVWFSRNSNVCHSSSCLCWSEIETETKSCTCKLLYVCFTCTLTYLNTKLFRPHTCARERAKYIAQSFRIHFSHNQHSISVECQILDLHFDAGNQPVCGMIDTLNISRRRNVDAVLFAHSNVTKMGSWRLVNCCLVICLHM
jgi:hypothetical protein